MRLRTLLNVTLLGIMIITSLGLPIEKELLRVKRKGEVDEENEGSRLQRKELSSILTRHRRESINENRRRRFESNEENTEDEEEIFPNKMAARSSRSSREDKDVTARGFDRFILPKHDIKGNKQPAKRSITTSGSGLESDFESSASGSGLWITDSAAKELLAGKVEKKRSASSLESIVAALSAITTDRTADFNGENEGSASGSWVISGSGQELNTPDDDLPKFFSAAASNSQYREVGETLSGSGSGMEERPVATKQGNLVSDLAEEVHQDNRPSSKTEASESQAKPLNNETKPIKIHKRDILEQFFGENHEDVLSRSRRDNVDKEVEETLTSFFRTNRPDKITSEDDQPIKHEPPPIPAGGSAKRGSKISQKSGSLESANGGEGLTGLSLVRRFYRDQNMEQTGRARGVKVPPKLEHHVKDTESKKQSIIKKTEEKVNPKRKVAKHNPFEPRVVHEKQLPKAHVTIIEEPAVYTKNDEEGMDSSDGGMNEDESDESEPTIEIHERDIREDGYVGCYADQSPDRDLPFALSVRDLTPTTCRLACKEAQHAYAALQYGYLCRCGDSYGKYSRLSEDQCSTACKGDGTQICGGFFRSSIYATEGVTEPTQGDFFHVESVRPLNAVINKPSSTSNYMPPAYFSSAPYRTPNQFLFTNPVVQFAPSVQAPTYFTPDEPKVVIHSETPLPEYQAKPPQPAVVKANVVNIPVQRPRFYPSVIGNMEQPPQQKKSTIARPPAAPKMSPQGARVSKLHYLHQQHAVAPKPKPQYQPFNHVDITPGSKTFTGTIKLKQSWLDGLQNDQSPEFKILSGNIEQAFKKMFEKDPNFIKAKVLGFNKGLVKHNPATVRKVVAPFVLTFKQDSTGIENRVSKAIQDTGKLFDMPVYKESIHIQEYHEAPKPSVTKDKIVPRKEAKNETKRSSTTQPKPPYTLELFLLRDPGKIKRSTQPKKQ